MAYPLEPDAAPGAREPRITGVLGAHTANADLSALDGTDRRRSIAVSCRRYTIQEASLSVHHELTVWSRGIIMDKEARDVSTCIATAARKLGYYAENVSDYVDDPDRTNCLVRRYARFADEPILDRFVYENPHPDWVVLVEETIIKAVNFFHRTPPARGVLVINSARDPQYLLKFLPEPMLAKLDKLVVVDATGLAEQRGASPWMFVRDLSELAFDRMSTEGAVERLAVGRGIAAPLIGALVAATGVLPVEAVAEVGAGREAMLRGAEKHI